MAFAPEDAGQLAHVAIPVHGKGLTAPAGAKFPPVPAAVTEYAFLEPPPGSVLLAESCAVIHGLTSPAQSHLLALYVF